MSSNPDHETDNAAKPVKQEGTCSHNHDSIGARVGEGVSYVSLLTIVAQPTYAQLNRHKQAVR